MSIILQAAFSPSLSARKRQLHGGSGVSLALRRLSLSDSRLLLSKQQLVIEEKVCGGDSERQLIESASICTGRRRTLVAACFNWLTRLVSLPASDRKILIRRRDGQLYLAG